MLRVANISVTTNLVTQLNARTTQEEAAKEVGRILKAKNLFASYEWKIEGCSDGGINEFNDALKDQIVKRIEEEEEDCVNWDGMRAVFELELFDITVVTDVVTYLKSQSKEDAVEEVNTMIHNNELFDVTEWNIKGCQETGINDLSNRLQNEILDRVKESLCVEEES